MNSINGLLGPFLKTIAGNWNRRRQPQYRGRIYIEGIQNPVHIDRDSWGIPQIQAESRADLYFSQGFVHAQERLWQMEINRRAAKGELSAILGRPGLETDRLTRTLGFKDLAPRSWESMSQRGREDVIAYTAGINAYLEGNHPLPIEFTLLRHRPAAWDPLDSVAFARLVMWTLSHGWAGELTRARIIEQLGSDIAEILEPVYPKDRPVTLPDGIEFNRLQLDGMMEAAAGPYLARGMEGAGRGSNGWVISSSRSTSGHALLANDVHLPIGTPALWYFSHLKQIGANEDLPILDAAGVSLPGMPYILIGHNRHIAWGATLSYVDCEDLFVERFHPDNHSRYLFDDEWLEAEIRQECIQVKGEPDHIEEVITTRHGPVISKIIGAEDTALALQSTAFIPEACFEGIASLVDVRSWDAFVEAAACIQSPSLNLVYADREDN
ncbi:MAG: penicillin acylase family protein, partial [Candidatus Promineifilaceae bacterium]